MNEIQNKVKYEKYSYLFPPRPEQTTNHTELSKYDNGDFIAQPKYNGTCCVVFISEDEVVVMNRHKGKITSDYSDIDFKGLHRGKGWMVLCGEFLNKNKKGEDGKPFNLKFVIWDILVYESNYLVGSTIIERLTLLENLYPCTKIAVDETHMKVLKHACFTCQKNVYRAPTYGKDFNMLYAQIVDTDLYEGLVLKRKTAKLTFGLVEKNNNTWQIKCRKPTKNYDF
jgi:ATP-dependent DNA ligase